MAVAVISPLLAACGSDGGPSADSSASTTRTSGTSPTSDAGPVDDRAAAPRPAEPLRWARTDLGFVSAYVLTRGTEATIVDTGTPGSAAAIGATLADLGLDYSDVRHVILTHYHGDHAGSIGEILTEAPSAATHAGAADIAEIAAEGIREVADGEDVFGLEVIATPGHTPGHICVIDHEAGVLVAGDAITSFDGGVQGPNPDFTDDLDLAHESARRLGLLTFDTLLAGHGEPIEGMADTAVADLAASL